jgi:D-aminoacyl-tRNA deacylase
MRAVVQRVSEARVAVDGAVVAEIGCGLLVLLGVGQGDTAADARYLADKVATLRVFEDEAGKMNLPVSAVAGDILVVSQFTLYGDCRKGRRPSFVAAMPPDPAAALCETFVGSLRERGFRAPTGVFGATMKVALVNEGPVTLLLSTDPAP